MTYEKASYFWASGKLSEKMQAARVAGLIWGQDIDQVQQREESDPNQRDLDKKQFEADFGMTHEEYMKLVQEG